MGERGNATDGQFLAGVGRLADGRKSSLAREVVFLPCATLK